MKLISYTTKPGLAAENRTRIEAVFAALQDTKLADFSYLVVEAGEGRFFHIVQAEVAALETLRAMPAFREFSSTVGERQAAPAVTNEVRIVGSYGRLVSE